MYTRLLLSLIALLAALGLRAQDLVLDPAVRQGQLPCGLTYYIMYSPRPAYKANFYLITRVGSTSELDNERGMAHFLEHCAFNGSTHFPGKGLQTTLERHGLKFGYDINANTAFDATTFNISHVDMTLDEAMLDTCLLALKDIACELTLADDAIEAERRIILEEWREGADAFERYTATALPVLFGDSCRYAHRMPIGTPEVIANFPPQALRDFYRRWYQPQHQALVVVGYVIPDEVEDAIRRIWGGVKAPKKPSVREWAQIPDHADTRVGAFADPEFPGCQMDFWWLVPTPPRGERSTSQYYRECLVGTFAMLALDSRMKDVLHEPDSPWTGAAADYDQYYYSDSRDGFRLYALYDRARRAEALERVVAMAKSAAVAGLSPSEVEAARQQMLSIADEIPRMRSERNNDEIATDLIRDFVNDNVMLDPVVEQELYRSLVANISAAELNAFLASTLTPANLAVMFAEKGAEAADAQSLAADVEALWRTVPVDNSALLADAASLELMPVLPEPGVLVDTREEKPFGAKIYTFANGARVIVCPSRVLSNRVDFAAVRPGGLAAMADSGYVEALACDDLANISGLGHLSANDLRKILAPTGVALEASSTSHADALFGTCRIDEIPTLLQLAHLRLTQPRRDTVAFANWKKATIGSIADRSDNPEHVFTNIVSRMYYGNDHPMWRWLTERGIDTLSYDRAQRLYSQRIASPASYTYVITGDFNPDSVLPHVARYIGSLPAAPPRPALGDMPKLQALRGERRCDFPFPASDDKAMAHIGYELHEPYTVQTDMTLQVLRLLLETELTRTLRTEQGATYGAELSADALRDDDVVALAVTFHTNTAALESAIDTVRAALAALAADGPDAEAFDQARSYLSEIYYTATLQQDYPMEYYTALALTGKRTVADRVPALATLTATDVQSLAQRLLQADARVVVTMIPVEN